MDTRAPLLRRIACASFALLAACAPRGPAGAGGASALRRELLRAGSVEIVAGEAELEVVARQLAARAAEGSPLLFTACAAGAETGAGARVVLGSQRSPAAIALLERAGVRVAGDPGHAGFTCAELELRGPSDSVRATFEDPARPGLPVTVVFGNSPAALAAICRDLVPPSRPWIELLRAGDLVLSGPLESDGQPGRADPSRVGFERMARAHPHRDVSKDRPLIALRVAPDVDEADAADAVRAVGAARSRTMEWMEAESSYPALELTLVGSEREFELWGGRDLPWTVNPVDARACAFVPRAGGFAPDAGAPAALAEARALLGRAARDWMEDAAAVHGAQSWFGVELDPWLARLALAADRPGIAAILDPRADGARSPHVLVPLRAAVWRHWIETRGAAYVRELWRGTRVPEFGAELGPDLDAAFWRSIEARTAALREPLDRARAEKSGALDASRLVGFVLPAPRRSGAPFPGMVGHVPGDDAWLAAARALGADTLALAVESAGTEDPFDRDDAAPLRRFGFESGEAATVALARRARAAGFVVAVLPRLLTTPSGTFAGNVPSWDEAGWDECYRQYARFVEHGALAGELGGASLVALGAGMRSIAVVAPESPSAPWKRRGLELVLRAARGATSARLVWVAESLLEARAHELQGRLDLVAGTVPAPAELDLRGEQGPARLEAHLAASARGYATLGVELQKRVLLAPIGLLQRPRADRAPALAGQDPERRRAMQLHVLAQTIARVTAPGARNPLPVGRLVACDPDSGDDLVTGRIADALRAFFRAP